MQLQIVLQAERAAVSTECSGSVAHFRCTARDVVEMVNLWDPELHSLLVIHSSNAWMPNEWRYVVNSGAISGPLYSVSWSVGRRQRTIIQFLSIKHRNRTLHNGPERRG